MDGSIGQAAFDQAKAFKDSVEVALTLISEALPTSDTHDVHVWNVQ